MGDMPKEVTITKLSSHTGAEVQGVDLTRPLQPAERERLYRAFVERSVLVIRGQRLDAPQFLAAMQNFGTTKTNWRMEASTSRAKVITPTIPTTRYRPRRPHSTRSGYPRPVETRSS